MNNANVLSEIAYLDDESVAYGEKGLLSEPAELIEFVHAAIQLEIARQARWALSTDEMPSRVACLEAEVKKLARDIALQRQRPVVQYVDLASAYEMSVGIDLPEKLSTSPRLPRTIIAFYAFGLLCSLLFAVLLVLSSKGFNPIHPFLSLLGFVGGLGWLTTAWTDLLLWKRDIMPSCESGTYKENSAA